jgi:hypothetical protein
VNSIHCKSPDFQAPGVVGAMILPSNCVKQVFIFGKSNIRIGKKEKCPCGGSIPEIQCQLHNQDLKKIPNGEGKHIQMELSSSMPPLYKQLPTLPQMPGSHFNNNFRRF